MSLTQNDLNKLGNLIDEKLTARDVVLDKRLLEETDTRDERLVEKMGEMQKSLLGEMDTRDERLVEKMGEMIDERMMIFFEQVIARAIDGVAEDLKEYISRVEDNTYRIEKKLDNIADHHSGKIDDHEKRIVRLEKDKKGWIASVA